MFLASKLWMGQIQPVSSQSEGAHHLHITYGYGYFLIQWQTDSCNRNNMAQKAENIYKLALYRKRILTAVLDKEPTRLGE